MKKLESDSDLFRLWLAGVLVLGVFPAGIMLVAWAGLGLLGAVSVPTTDQIEGSGLLALAFGAVFSTLICINICGSDKRN